jgi:D-sedoheptulose 7-phosphate isomerase
MGISGYEQHGVVLPSIRPEPTYTDCYTTIVNILVSRRMALDTALGQLAARAMTLTEVATRLVETLGRGHKVLVAGNGGSAAEAQHFAAELVGRFKRERTPYAVLSLTTDTAILTAVANDYGYQDIFARQVFAFGQPEDMLIAFSTSGESENLVHAAVAAHRCLMTVVAITGERTSRLEKLADITVRVPTVDTAIAQELHMVLTHVLCDIAEARLATYENREINE